MSNRSRISIDLSEDILGKLKDVADKSEMSPSLVARAYIEKCLNDKIIPSMNVTFNYTKETKKPKKNTQEKIDKTDYFKNIPLENESYK